MAGTSVQSGPADVVEPLAAGALFAEDRPHGRLAGLGGVGDVEACLELTVVAVERALAPPGGGIEPIPDELFLLAEDRRNRFVARSAEAFEHPAVMGELEQVPVVFSCPESGVAGGRWPRSGRVADLEGEAVVDRGDGQVMLDVAGRVAGRDAGCRATDEQVGLSGPAVDRGQLTGQDQRRAVIHGRDGRRSPGIRAERLVDLDRAVRAFGGQAGEDPAFEVVAVGDEHPSEWVIDR